MARGFDGIKREDSLDLQALAYFVKVGEVRSFSKASTILNVSQPTLSRHVQYLEEHFGARLFDRTGRGVVLTETGERLLQHGKEILFRASEARAEIANIGNPGTDSVILGLAPIAGRILSVPVAKRAIRELPGTRLRIVEFFTGYVKEWIEDGRIDVGILYADSTPASGDEEVLWDEYYVLVGRRGNRFGGKQHIPFGELKDVPLVLPSGPHGLRMKIEEIAARTGISLNVVLEIDGLNLILDIVHHGVASTILTPPALYGDDRLEELVVTPIVEPRISSTAIVVCTTKRPITNGTRRVVELIRDEARHHLADQSGIDADICRHQRASAGAPPDSAKVPRA